VADVWELDAYLEEEQRKAQQEEGEGEEGAPFRVSKEAGYVGVAVEGGLWELGESR
jgi:hypothetical protein